MEETFGSGMIFRSYENVELDEDYRVTGFKFGYDRGLRLKALYSGFSGGGVLSISLFYLPIIFG